MLTTVVVVLMVVMALAAAMRVMMRWMRWMANEWPAFRTKHHSLYAVPRTFFGFKLYWVYNFICVLCGYDAAIARGLRGQSADHKAKTSA